MPVTDPIDDFDEAGEFLQGHNPSALLDGVTQLDLLETIYPIGYVFTYPVVGLAGSLSGGTLPEVGAFGGSFYAFDKAGTESIVFSLGGLMQPHVSEVDLYLETFFFGDPGATDKVRWQHDFFGGGSDAQKTDVGTTQTVVQAADGKQTVFRLGAESYTLGSNTIAGVTKRGGTVVIDRLGGDALDTLDADIQVASLHAVRTA